MKRPNIQCDNCEQWFYKKPSHIKVSKHHFCRPRCMHEYRTEKIECLCAACGATVYRTPSELKKTKSGRAFCSRSCATSYNNKRYRTGTDHPNFTDGKSTYRDRGLRAHGAECQSKCCPTRNFAPKREMMDVHHINGDRNNNTIENLVVLCVWCHRLVTSGSVSLEEIL